MSSLKRLVLTLLAMLAMLLILPVTPALAHTNLISSDPAAGSTLTQLPEQVTLTFDQPLLTDAVVNHISVIDPMGQQIAAPAVLASPTVLTSVLSPSMIMAGSYQVAFRVVAGDGHPVEASFRFAIGSQAAAESPIPVPSSGTAVLTVSADGKQIPNGEGDPTGVATGTFTIDFAAGTICYTVTSSLTGVSGIHVHARNADNMTVADEISIPVSLQALNSPTPVCGTPPGQDLARLAATPDRFALVIHTQDYPEGAVMGTFAMSNTSSPSTEGGRSSGPGPVVVAVGIGLVLVVAAGVVLIGRRRVRKE